MANRITGIRMVCSFALLFCVTFSRPFYILYLIAGISDMLDGAVARKMGTVSEFGSKLDTLADTIFCVVCLIKILPAFHLERWMLLWVSGIAIIKGVNIVSGMILYRRFVAVHSVMNKITGLLLFLLPLTIRIIPLRYSVATVCAIATFSAIQEGHFIRTEKS
ncbi:MAG: CDP-alcohol phosphatidyltransferase family protein [Lachnospiraceae bacterium]|nr:CDP-alcohol phosphatidyltransferase family protein [Lachnospiraceae bacterium]